MRYSISISSLLLVVLLAIPFFAMAEDGAYELESTIREAILSDPRTADMTASEIDAMVAVLSERARSQGVNSADITWRPDAPSHMPTEETCDFLCQLTRSFGFEGNDITIPIGLAVSSALLLFLIGSLLLHHHGHHPIAGAIGAPRQL